MRFLGTSLLLSTLLVGAMTGCSSSSSDVAVPTTSRSKIDTVLLSESWPIQFLDPSVSQSVESDPVWVELVMRRNIRAAVKLANQEHPVSAARAHADASDLFRVAALLSAHSLIQTYGLSRQETDPQDVEHLLMVSYAMVGERDKAKEMAKKPHTSLVTPWSKPWISWLSGDSDWPPDLSQLPMDLPGHVIGGWPDITPSLPTFSLPEQGSGGLLVDYTDPSVLLVLSNWHASVAASAGVPGLAAYSVRYQLPVEPPVMAPATPSTEMIFGSDFLHPQDGAFIAQVMVDGHKAISAFEKTSLMASLLATCLVDNAISADKVLDLSTVLRGTLREEMARLSGEEPVFARPFSDIASVALIRIGALVAEADGDRQTSGVLQINAMERSKKHTGFVPALLSLAAWDASNRAPMRPNEMLHYMINRYPGLVAARYSLDPLAVRVSRQSVNQGVGM